MGKSMSGEVHVGEVHVGLDPTTGLATSVEQDVSKKNSSVKWRKLK